MAVMRRLGTAIVCVFVALAILNSWYALAANYDYNALAGAYSFELNGDSWLLRLHADQNFTEQVTRAGRTQITQGQWRRYGEAHVSFSSSFLPLLGEEFDRSGEAHGQFNKFLGLWPSLTLAPIPDGPTLHKRFVR